MEKDLQEKLGNLASQGGATGILCADSRGFAIHADGSLAPEAAGPGIVSELGKLAGKLEQQNHNSSPVVVLETKSSNIMINSTDKEKLTIAVEKDIR